MAISEWEIHGARGVFQAIVEALMRTLLEDHPTLLDERDVSTPMDADYCKGVVGLHICNFALLRPRGREHRMQGHARYGEHVCPYRFCVCSQWWKNHHRSNAMARLRFVSRLAVRSPEHPGAPRLNRRIEHIEHYASTGHA